MQVKESMRQIIEERGFPRSFYHWLYSEDVMRGRLVTREVAENAPRMDSDLNLAYVRDPDDWDSFALLSEVFPH